MAKKKEAKLKVNVRMPERLHLRLRAWAESRGMKLEWAYKLAAERLLESPASEKVA